MIDINYQLNSEIDVYEKSCTLLIIQIIKTMSVASEGDIFRITSTDSKSIYEITFFCKLTGNKLLDSRTDGETYIFFIEKGF